MPVYSEDRTGRLRMVLWIVLVIGALVALLAVVTVAQGEHRGAGVVAVVIAGLLIGSSGTALRLLPDAERPAKIAAVVTGVLCLVCGVASGSVVAFLLLVIGLGLLFLALLPDEIGGES
jgi:ABC-type Fe3+-siderophore transport system permease subunit